MTNDALRLPDALRLAMERHQANDLDAAEGLYRRILDRLPEQADALNFLGMLKQQKGDGQAALALLRRAVAAAPDNPAAHNNLGNVLMAEGLRDEAAVAYQKTLELDADHAEAHANLAYIRVAQERYDEAVAGYRHALALKPERIYLYQHLGFLLYRLDRLDESAQIYRAWMAVDPQDPVPRHLLAARLGQTVPAQADAHYVKAVFDDMADTFDEHLQHLEYHAPDLVIGAVRQAFGPARADLAVLDAGCGTGLCAAGLRPYAENLVGVDLSPRMLEKADQRAVYDQLVVAELAAYLEAYPDTWDLVVSADTLIYFGDLTSVARAAAAGLRRGGYLVFTAEQAEGTLETDRYHLMPHGRYAHRRDYLEQVLSGEGLSVLGLEPVHLRKEGGAWVEGWLAVARKPVA